jgi:hypothetical protein
MLDQSPLHHNLTGMKNFKTALIILALFSSQQSLAGLLYTYNQLAVMELDQLNKLVEDKVKESKKSAARFVPLKEAFQALFGRPDQDRMLEKVAGPIRAELVNLGDYEKTVTQLTEEAINALTNTRNFKPTAQITYVIFLENLMADIKPVLKPGDTFEKKILKKIEKAKISITKAATNDLLNRGFQEKKSPSEVASLILDELKNKEVKLTAEEKKD